MTRATTRRGSGPTGKRRAGTTLDERKALALALENAALDIIGEEGATQVTVRALCRRYFYESFDSRDDLVVGLFASVADEVHNTLAAAVRGVPKGDAAAVTIESLVDYVIADPRKARLLLVEPLAEPALGGISVAQVPAFTKLIRTQLPPSADKNKRVLASVGLAGALAAIFFGWLSGSVRASREEIIGLRGAAQQRGNGRRHPPHLSAGRGEIRPAPLTFDQEPGAHRRRRRIDHAEDLTLWPRSTPVDSSKNIMFLKS